ncbi:MAG: hypothetical protein ACLR78_06215 [Roseburia sp.]
MQELKAGVTDAAVEKARACMPQWKAIMFMSWSERQNINTLKENISLGRITDSISIREYTENS